MGKVTACKMDVVTKKSGHQMTGMAVSVCTTPAAPSPVPIPYPTMGTVAEGILDPCMRTKIGGAIVMTVGSCMSKCHGNEPGTLKEVVSLNTAGPCFPIMGAPNVFMELGMAGITTSPGQMNKSITVGASGSASGAGGGGSGAGGGGGGGGGPPGASTSGPSGGGGGGGGSSQGAGPPSPPAPPGAEGQASAGHPVDVVTGTLFSQSVDFRLRGHFPVHFLRQYFSSAVEEHCGIGYGWSHALAWRGRLRGDRFTLIDERQRRTELALPGSDEALALPHGRQLRVEGEALLIDGVDDLTRVLRAEEDGHFFLAELRDRFGARAALRWEGGELCEIVDTVGRRATMERDGAFRIWTLSVDNAEGVEHRRRLVTFEIDERGDLVRVIDAGGTETRYEYDDRHYLVAETRPDGVVYRFRYDDVAGQRRCVETWGELPGLDLFELLGRPSGEGRTPRGIFHTRFEYEPGRRRTRMIDAEGGVHLYEGNRLGLVERYVDPDGAASELRFDDRGALTSITDPGGGLEMRQHAADGRPRAFVAPDGAAVRYQYDDETGDVRTRGPDDFAARRRLRNGLVVELEDANGRLTAADYDEHGRNVAVHHPGGLEDRLEYDAHGNLSAYAQGEAVTRYDWDLFGMPLSITSPMGSEIRFGYDSYGNVARIVTPTGGVIEHDVDADKRIWATTFPGGGRASYRWVAGALVEQTHPDGSVWKMGWDALRRLRWIENPAGERHSIDYDAAGRVRRTISFTGLTSYFDYDANGRVSRIVRSDESTTRYLRDPAGRILSREHSSGVIEHVEYDRFGRLTSVSNGVSRVALTYRSDGLLARDEQTCGGHAFAVDYDYDEQGKLVGRRYSTGWSVAVDNDACGRAQGLTIADGDQRTDVVIDRDLDGREVRRGFPEGPALSMTRDPMGHLTQLDVVDGEGEVLGGRSWTWSAVGPVSAVTDSTRGERRYELDEHGRPVSASGLATRARFSVAPQGTALSEGMQVGAGGRPTRLADGTELSWDRRGRLSERRGPSPESTFSYAYDHNDQLVEVRRGDGRVIQYLYDPLGRRIAEIVGDRSTWFGWDGDSSVEEMPTGGGCTRRVFARDGHTPLVEIEGDTPRLVATDTAATPWALVDEGGEISDLELSTWGERVYASGASSALRFAGQRHDEATGLHYNRYRYYAPDLHVFTTPDPLGLWASTQEVGFVPNPTLYLDPLGLLTIVTASTDPALANAYYSRYQTMYPNATILTPSQVVPGSLDGESDVVIDTHGAPGQVQWGNEWINGSQLADRLENAGFEGTPGSRVEVIACNSATKPGTFRRSVSQAVADRTGATTSGAAAAPVQGVGNATAAGNAGDSGLLSGMPTGLGTGSAPGNMNVNGGGSYVSDVEPRWWTLGF